MFLFQWRRARDFVSALPHLSPRYARCHVGENSPQDYFLPKASLSPSLFESLAYAIPNTKTKTPLLRCSCLWRRARDSNPRSRFSDLHDFQSCSFDQLGQLSGYLIALTLYTSTQKKSSLFTILFQFSCLKFFLRLICVHYHKIAVYPQGACQAAYCVLCLRCRHL